MSWIYAEWSVMVRASSAGAVGKLMAVQCGRQVGFKLGENQSLKTPGKDGHQ